MDPRGLLPQEARGRCRQALPTCWLVVRVRAAGPPVRPTG
ncbi:hypothetical protein FHR38_002550 [Micromonospora polyrhachis]|uniref:Uncharacterized protein n=1 Tax=Micromonospora polyrhachis TaxID=1282883 RepID=A0A7W7WPR8_9ACTN|nr:hypothetical protein [Micromonospora polyrhachis]